MADDRQISTNLSPLDARVQSQFEPLSIGGAKVYVATGAVIVGLLEAAAALLNIIAIFSKDKTNNDLLGKIQGIIGRLSEIIGAIETLKDFIPVALTSAFRQDMTYTIGANIDVFKQITSGLSDKEIEKLSESSRIFQKIDDLAMNHLEMVHKLKRYGYPGYFGVASGALSYLAMGRVLRISRTEAVHFASEISSWLRDAVNPTQPESFGDARSKMALKANALRTSVADMLGKEFFVGTYTVRALQSTPRSQAPGREMREPREPREPLPTAQVNWYATLAGSFDGGLSWSAGKAIENEPNARRRPMLPGESNIWLKEGDGEAQVRLHNSMNGWSGFPGLNSTLGEGRAIEARASELDKTIAGITELVAKLNEAAAAFPKRT